MKMKFMLLVVMFLTGCSSAGSLGIVMKSTADPGAVLRNQASYTEIGPASGEACRFFVLAILPFGQSDFAAAVDEALTSSGGDALLNVTVSSSLYGFIPIYNIFSYTCTNVRGIAVKFDKK